MMFRYLWSKPAGGGPAPLIRNPVQSWMIALVVSHLILFLFASLTFAFPSITDMSCRILVDNTAYCGICVAVAFSMLFYFSVLSCQDWGTEQYWAIGAVVTLSMACLDIVTAGWGNYVFFTATQTLQQAGSEIQKDCDEWKSIVFYYCTAAVIGLHMVIALMCGAVSFRLTGGISAQLEEIRRLV
ncbi:putative membrane protein [Besnoitia besnoiti]|uniref:Putative membrane protein n=1 Tax=Besnoitia besnoiti TaxID=94643 RepID=A0A2A9MP15_BESBE|nr:putative membrane protein [Besnoitia besnoiti]PFH37492.1 putative membrane protein [Besnoitia besnoiti]